MQLLYNQEWSYARWHRAKTGALHKRGKCHKHTNAHVINHKYTVLRATRKETTYMCNKETKRIQSECHFFQSFASYPHFLHQSLCAHKNIYIDFRTSKRTLCPQACKHGGADVASLFHCRWQHMPQDTSYSLVLDWTSKQTYCSLNAKLLFAAAFQDCTTRTATCPPRATPLPLTTASLIKRSIGSRCFLEASVLF